MVRFPCPVCDEGRVPVDLDFHPYSDELDCPYCKGRGYLNPDKIQDALNLIALQLLDVNDPDFQARVTALAEAEALKMAEDAAAELDLEHCAARRRRGGRVESAASTAANRPPLMRRLRIR